MLNFFRLPRACIHTVLSPGYGYLVTGTYGTASNRLFKSRILISVIGEWGSVPQYVNGLRICRSILSPTRSSSRPPQTSRFPRMDSSPNRSEASTTLPMLFIQQKWSTSQPYLVRAKVILYPYFGTEAVQHLIPPPLNSAVLLNLFVFFPHESFSLFVKFERKYLLGFNHCMFYCVFCFSLLVTLCRY